MPDFFEVLKGRRSVRVYSDQPVTDQELEELVEAAILAPNAMNQQVWRFSVVTNRHTLSDVDARIKEILHEQDIAGKMKMEGLKAALNSPDFSIFYHAPALIVITADKGNPSAMLDCNLAMENIFLAAHAQGLGTCYMGFLFFGRDDAKVRQMLHIPEGHDIMAACCVGHSKMTPEGPPKRNPPQVEWVR